jgi:molybdopterin/thiamine biosynthesis adenylyltransferase/rhodanese-related sulfurtransferase
MSLEIEPTQAAERLRGDDAPVLVDIREDWELEAGFIAGSEHVAMSDLGTRLDRYRQQELIIYCAHGNRSLRLAKALDDAGFESAVSLAGGITAWAEEGLPVELPGELDDAQRVRYSRHVLIPEIGVAGQQRLLNANVLVIGAGGLGSPAALYLGAAGIGRLGIVDDDVVDESNLQRQVLHSTAALGESKIASAEERIRGLRIPVVHGSIFRFEGQATVFAPGDGPCYRCLFPQPPPPELAPSCAEGGVLGVLPGVIGSIQGAEALKLVLGIGEPLIGRLLLYDALASTFDEVAVRRDPNCPVCGDSPTITEYVDYVEFCAGTR